MLDNHTEIYLKKHLSNTIKARYIIQLLYISYLEQIDVH